MDDFVKIGTNKKVVRGWVGPAIWVSVVLIMVSLFSLHRPADKLPG